jgi:thioredoxin-dependent peroxiredoxin
VTGPRLFFVFRSDLLPLADLPESMGKMAMLKKGEKAPDIEVKNIVGDDFHLQADLARHNFIALVFLRYIGCPVCQMRLWELEARRKDYEAAGAKVVVVLQSTGEAIRNAAGGKKLTVCVLADAQKELFDRYGIERATLGGYLAFPVLKSVLKATFAGHMHGAFRGDEFQKPADFIVAGDGNLVLAHYGRHIADNLPDALLLETIAKHSERLA